MQQINVPYCGIPPLPDALWSRWNFDPVLIAALIAIMAAYFVGDRRIVAIGPGSRRRETTLFCCGLAVLSAALISPLCALSVALFSARVGQHMIIVTIAAPLMAMGLPFRRMAALLSVSQPVRIVCDRTFGGKIVAGVLFAIVLWIWHAPRFYEATFTSEITYLAMHVTLFTSALLLWRSLLVRGMKEPLLTFGLGFATTMQMSLLGALFTFAARPMFFVHFTTTQAWGLTPLQDQQLGGLLMWVPGCSVVILSTLLLFGQLLRGLDSSHTNPLGR